MKILGSVKTIIYIYMVPVITAVTSALILHEKMTKAMICGIFLTFIRPVFIRGQEKEREEKLKWIRKETSLCSVRGVFLLIPAQFFINLQIYI